MTSSFLLLLLLSAQLIWAEEKWVWSSKSKKDTKGPVTFEGSTTNNDNIIQTVDNIVIMGRSGRKISGFDSLYEDPESLQALSSENETFARSAIAQRICSLKLTKCDEETARHFNFGFGSGHHNQQGFIQSNAPVIVAQPVALKPVGPPVQAIPLTNGNHAQGVNYNGGVSIQYGQTIHRPLAPTVQQHLPVFQERPISRPILPPQRPFGLVPRPIASVIRPVGSVGGDIYGNNKVQHVHQHVHYHNEEHINEGHSNLIGIPKPIYEGAEFLGNDYYRDQNQLNCDCVPLYQCDEEYIRRNFNQQHLAIDPRAPDIDIDIDDTNTTEASTEKSNRKRRDVGTPNEDEGRSFSEKRNHGPNRRSCQEGYICCPNRNSRRLGGKSRCGIRNILPITGRVKNDEAYSGDSDYGEYPWQVAILKNENAGQVYVSGGVLIDDTHVLTSAHNLIESKARSEHLILRLGEYDVTTEDEQYKHVDAGAQSVLIHPDFNKVTLRNDIAIITLNKRMNFNDNIHITPACMPSPFTDYTGQRCWTAGWGKDDQKNGHYQTVLKEVDLPIVNSRTCEALLQRERLGANFNLFEGFICAGGESGKDACKGDGGSPLVCQSNDGPMQVVGIVSWGLDCGRHNVPGVYTKVAHYLDWIKSNTQSNQYYNY